MPWRWEPGNAFHNAAVHGRISAGFEIQTHMIDDHEYDGEPHVVVRDLALPMVMAARRAKRAGVELDFAEVACWRAHRAGAAQRAPAAHCSTGAGRPKR